MISGTDKPLIKGRRMYASLKLQMAEWALNSKKDIIWEVDGDSRHEWIAIYKIFKQNFFIQEHRTKQICYCLNDLWFDLRSDLKIVSHQA